MTTAWLAAVALLTRAVKVARMLNFMVTNESVVMVIKRDEEVTIVFCWLW